MEDRKMEDRKMEDRKTKEEEQRERTAQMNHMGQIPDRAEKGPKPAAMEQREGDPKGEPVDRFDERTEEERRNDV